MDEFKKENKELIKVKDALEKKFKSQGLNKQQIEIKMMQLDVEFLIHAYVNGVPEKGLDLKSVKNRLQFYIDILSKYCDKE
jgi:hypothetical protein